MNAAGDHRNNHSTIHVPSNFGEPWNQVHLIPSNFCDSHFCCNWHTHTHPFYGCGFCQDNQGEPIAEETFTHSHLSWSSLICFLHLLWSTASCSVYMPDSLFLWSFTKFSLVYLLAWHPQLHTPYMSPPNHCLLFTAHAHTIATCFAAVPRLSSNPSLSTLYWELYFVA